MGRLLVSLMAISQTDKCRDLSTFACFTPFSLRLLHGPALCVSIKAEKDTTAAKGLAQCLK